MIIYQKGFGLSFGVSVDERFRLADGTAGDGDFKIRPVEQIADDRSGNQTGTPSFLTGPLGDNYLNQSTSPCVNAGSTTAANAGMADKTTNTTHSLDTGTVDMGFHYSP